MGLDPLDPDHVFTFANDAYLRLIGGRDLIGLPVRRALPEIEGQGFFELLDEVYQKGEEKGAQGANVRLRQAPGQPLEEFYLDFSYAPIRDREGHVSGVFVQGMDRTEATLAERRQQLLLAELNHRVKNTLATVQSIASQTLRSASDLPTARRAFEGRLVALSKTHNLLSERQWSSASIRVLVENELATYGGESFSAEGPDITINPKAAIAIAMVLHELAVNAAKYGALKEPGGRVSVRWALERNGGNDLVIEWREEGGPKVRKPSHEGFGTRMIDRVVTGELGGQFSCDYQEDGYMCSLSIPEEMYRSTDEND